jgi:2-oxoglutarate dehydrogenase E1 component
MEQEIHAKMDVNYDEVHGKKNEYKKPFSNVDLLVPDEEIKRLRNEGDTAIGDSVLKSVVDGMTNLPSGFNLHPKLNRLIESRKEFYSKDSGADWAIAEALAFGSLLLEGIPVRLSGQDCARGTFSHRHIAFTDIQTEKEIIPLNSITDNQAKVEVLDSLLSEAAVLGFEYGYTTVDPLTLVLWEAQFGDFANAAQVIIDNFIVSSYTKWKLQNHLVMLLPHGQEGQGSEHSSARLERFLTLCADNNMFVCYPTTPSQYFHLLRRQAKSTERKPMVIMSPKSLLRHPEAKSVRKEFTGGKFMEVIDDNIINKSSVTKILIATGKIYYDLLKYRTDNKLNDTAILRLEQIYPFPKNELLKIIKSYGNAKAVKWVQEEPENMGALNFVKVRLTEKETGTSLEFVSRKESASPAPGSYKVFNETQKQLIEKAFS